jgi:nucleoside-diphosphate-sugar epimerase
METTMLTDEKILVTGATGLLGLPVAEFLARDNEVWGLARFGESGSRAGAMGTDPAGLAELEAIGVTPCRVDLGEPDFSGLPRDFGYVLHLAHTRVGAEFHRAVQINAIGAGLVLQHCASANQLKAAIVMSSAAVYTPHDDEYHPLHEDDALGGAVTPWAPSSPVSKVSLEASARLCAAAFDLPVTVARLNTVYGPMGGLPIMNMDSVAAGETVQTFSDPYTHSPIHIDDLCDQIEAMLDAASVDATIVNWAGDEVVTLQEWTAQAGALSGVDPHIEITPIPGALNGNVADITRRRAITGPCRIKFAPAFAELHRQRHTQKG